MPKKPKSKTKQPKTKPRQQQAESKPAAKPPVKASEVVPLIPGGKLVTLLRTDDNIKGKIESLTGQLREEISNATEKNHLDKQAYALLKKFHRIKSNEKLANLWDTLLDYMDKTGVTKRIESVPTLGLSQSEEKPGDHEPEPEQQTAAEPQAEGNVTRADFGGGEEKTAA